MLYTPRPVLWKVCADAPDDNGATWGAGTYMTNFGNWSGAPNNAYPVGVSMNTEDYLYMGYK